MKAAKSKKNARQQATSSSELRAVRPKNKTYALGLACNVMMAEPAYARIPFADWCQILAGQVRRDHAFFVLDEADTVVGYAGWALADEKKASAWLEGKTDLSCEECIDGDCVVLNAWIAGSRSVQKFMIRHMRDALGDKRYIFAKRAYADGKMRPVKLRVTDFAGEIPDVELR